jgi:DNA-binding NtrC family response regulator
MVPLFFIFSNKTPGFSNIRGRNGQALAALDGPLIWSHRPAQPDYQRLLESARLRQPDIRFIVMMQQRTQQVVYVEHVDIVYKPLSLDEISRKIQHAIRQKRLRQAEEEFKRMRHEALRMFLG